MRVAVEYEWRMDLIGEDARIVCGGKVGDSLFLVKRKYLADRVVRVAQHERLASVAECLLDGIEVEGPCVAVLQHVDFYHVDVV